MPTETNNNVRQSCPGQLYEEQLEMLEKIAAIMETELSVDQVGYESDESWVKFHVAGKVDQFVMMELNKNSQRLFEGTNVREWQILKSMKLADGPGMWVHHLDDVASRLESKCGVLFY